MEKKDLKWTDFWKFSDRATKNQTGEAELKQLLQPEESELQR